MQFITLQAEHVKPQYARGSTIASNAQSEGSRRHLVLKLVVVRYQGGELAGLVEARA